jgi:hypothetical protein
MNPFFHFTQPYFLMKNNNVNHITQKTLSKQTYFNYKNKRVEKMLNQALYKQKQLRKTPKMPN